MERDKYKKEWIEIGKIISFIGTLIILLLVNWILTKIFSMNFVDASFYVGLASIVIVLIANSSGGLIGDAFNKGIQSETGLKINNDKKNFNPRLFFCFNTLSNWSNYCYSYCL